MELMQLEMFVAVVEEGSVRRAADRVFRTQPAVSIAVRKLEDEIEASLFDRSKRYDFRLTQAGESLYRYAKRMLNLRQEATAELEDIRNLRVGRLRIGANESVSLHLLPQIMQAHVHRHPGTLMEVTCERSENLLNDLKRRRLDLVLISFRPNDIDFESAFVMQDEMVVIAHPSHPLAGKRNVQFEELSGEQLLTMDISEPSPWHDTVTDACSRAKIACHLAVKNAPIEAIKKMVALGLGVGFVPLLSVTEENARCELTILDVHGFHEPRSVWIVQRWGLNSLLGEAFAALAVMFGEEIQKRHEPSVQGAIAAQRAQLSQTPKIQMIKRHAPIHQ